jgi:type III secretory pathway component EscR
MKISNQHLALIGLLAAIGLLSIYFTIGTPFILLSYVMCLVGGASLGILASRK